MILIDTPLLEELLMGNVETATIIQNLDSTPSIAAITAVKILSQAEKRKELKMLKKFLAMFTLIHPNQKSSQLAIDLISKYTISYPISIETAFIAATAINSNISLMTHRLEKYKFIDGLRIYQYS